MSKDKYKDLLKTGPIFVEGRSSENEGTAIEFCMPPDAIIELTEQIEGLTDEYLKWASDFITGLFQLIKVAETNRNSSSIYLTQMKNNTLIISEISLGMKYPMVTNISDSLIHFLTHSYSFNELTIEMVIAHIRGMRFIIDEKITGYSNVTGQRMVGRLQEEVITVLNFKPSGDATP